MKIHEGRDAIKRQNQYAQGEIPLAYIDKQHEKEKFNLIYRANQLEEESVAAVYPGEIFEENNPFLFNKDKERASVLQDMIKKQNHYHYSPTGATEFTPAMFDFSVSVKRAFNYDTSKSVNIRVAIAEKHDTLQNAFMLIAGDAHRRGMITQNFKINNGDIKKESLTNSAIKDNDVLIIESEDGVNYWDSLQAIPFDEILDEHTNIWLALGDNHDYNAPIESYVEFREDIAITGGMIYRNTAMDTFEAVAGINEDEIKRLFPGYTYEASLFRYDMPVAVFHKEKKGYVFVSHKSVITNALSNYKLIYEMLNRIYLEGYQKTNWITSWITDAPVNYMIKKDTPLERRHPQFIVENLFSNRPATEDQLYIADVTILQDNVMLSGLNENNELFFIKTDNQDPIKGQKEKSYLTTKGTIIYIEDNSLFKVESPIQYSIKQTMQGNYLELEPLVSTKLKINTPFTVLPVPSNAEVFSVYVENNLLKIITGLPAESLLSFRKESETQTTVYDLRVMGGGAPKDSYLEGDYFDLSHLKGKLYRKGGAMVIKLPKKLAAYESYIRTALARHIAGGSYYVIVYKEEE